MTERTTDRVEADQESCLTERWGKQQYCHIPSGGTQGVTALDFTAVWREDGLGTEPRRVPPSWETEATKATERLTDQDDQYGSPPLPSQRIPLISSPHFPFLCSLLRPAPSFNLECSLTPIPFILWPFPSSSFLSAVCHWTLELNNHILLFHNIEIKKCFSINWKEPYLNMKTLAQPITEPYSPSNANANANPEVVYR